MQIHLYSDGGIDVSCDGRYLLTCARVYLPPFYGEWLAGNAAKLASNNATPPSAHPARLVADEQEIPAARRLFPTRSPGAVEGTPVAAAGGAGGSSRGSPMAPSPPLFVPRNRRNQLYSTGGGGTSGTNSAALSNATSKNASPVPTTAVIPSMHASSSGGSLHSDLPDLISGLTISGQRTCDGVPAVIDLTRGKTSLPPPPGSIASMRAAESPSSVTAAGKGANGFNKNNSNGSSEFCPMRAQVAFMPQRRIAPQQRHKMIRVGERCPQG